MNFDVIIVGAGASGLVAAISAARQGSSVLIIEQKEKAGKKILATGNGKCNYTNRVQLPQCYRSDNTSFPMKVLSNFDYEKTIAFFQELGIYPKDRNGYLYPNSEQAASVVEVLLMECRRLGVHLAFHERVVSIQEPKYTITTQVDNLTKRYFTKKLILATGGCASSKLGSDGSGYALAKSLGHTIIKPLPALVSLKARDKFCRTVSGVRTIARVTAYEREQILDSEEGEIIFTDYGISGIPIMQLSRFAAKALDQAKQVHLILDFMPDTNYEELTRLLTDRRSNSPGKSLEEMMVGLFNHKLSYIMIKEAGLNTEKPSEKLTDSELKSLLDKIKRLKLNIVDTNSFENAQVSAGGVDTREVKENSLESKLSKGLYLTGELLDVDGTCGGYNLQWAWSTGYLAGAAAGQVIK